MDAPVGEWVLRIKVVRRDGVDAKEGVVIGLVQFREDDDGPLQPFCAVIGGDHAAVGTASLGLAGFCLADVGHKAVERCGSARGALQLFVFCRQSAEHFDVGPAGRRVCSSLTRAA